MPGITIVSSSPGTEKTTLARSLAETSSMGLHVVSDDFYRYPAVLILPTTPETREQNETLLRAVARHQAKGALRLERSMWEA